MCIRDRNGTDRPAIAGNLNCDDDMPPESLMLAANKLDISLYYLCSNATDSGIKGSFIYKRVLELERTINLFNEAGIKPHNIYLSGFSAGGWTALMAAKAIPRKFNKGVLFAPAFAGPRYETRFFPVWRKIIRPKQVKEILKAEKLEFLIFAYEDDPFNRPIEQVTRQNIYDENTGEIKYVQETPRFEKDNYNLNYGISAQISIPLGKAPALCHKATEINIKNQELLYQKTLLETAMFRLKLCGEQANLGVTFVGEYARICEGIKVTVPPNQVIPHSHSLTSEK